MGIGIDIGMEMPMEIRLGSFDTGLWRCAHECGHKNGDGQKKKLKILWG